MKQIVNFFRDGKFEEMLGCVALTLVIVPVILNIINRSFLNKYSLNLESIALLAYVWIGYGFFGYMFKREAHVDVKFIVNLLPGPARLFMDVLRELLIFCFSVYMTWWGFKLTQSNLARYVAGPIFLWPTAMPASPSASAPGRSTASARCCAGFWDSLKRKGRRKLTNERF